MDEQDRKIILEFLKRVTLQGTEVDAYNHVIKVLNEVEEDGTDNI